MQGVDARALHLRSWRAVLAVLAAGLLALGAAACGGNDSDDSGSGSGGDPIKIGVLAPTSGPMQGNGEDMVNATELAVDAVNAEGGIDGRQIEIVVADDACEAQQGVQAAEKLVQDEVVAVVGGYCSAAALPAAEVFRRNGGVPFLLTVPSNPQLTEAGDENITRFIGRDDQEAPAQVKYLQQVIGSKNVAIVHDNTEFAVSVANEMKRILEEEEDSPKIVYFDAVQPGGNDYRPALERVARTDADTLVYTGFYPEFAQIARQWGSGNYDYNLIGGASTIDATVVEMAPEATKDERFSIMTYPTALLLQGQKADDYRTLYKDEIGSEPGSYGVFQYDAMQALFDALKADPDDLSPEALSARMRETNMEGITGQIDFNENGDRNAPPVLAVRNNGENLAAVYELHDGETWEKVAE